MGCNKNLPHLCAFKIYMTDVGLLLVRQVWGEVLLLMKTGFSQS